MSGKRIGIGQRPAGTSDADTWVRRGDDTIVAEASRGELFGARLTVDVTSKLRGRIKVAAFRKGMTVAGMLRELFEREFPESGGDS